MYKRQTKECRDPHPEYSTGTAKRNSSDHAYQVSHADAGGCGNDQSCLLYTSVPIARVFDKSMCSIRRILDAGAMGVIVPMIRTADDAREVVKAAKFPPLGIRGAGAGPYCGYGITLNEAIATGNEETLVIVLSLIHI